MRVGALAALLAVGCCAATVTSAPPLALPSAKQLDFQNNHPIGCFFHFGINTFTGQEHGTGDAKQSPALFTAPVDLDTDQWVQSCVSLGGTYAVFTAKHEEGMMNWPSESTNYSIASSPFCAARKAAGRSCDLVKQFLESCDKFNVTRGLYFTFFNSHCKTDPTGGAAPGTSCSQMLRNAFTELATGYGPIAQFWFDHGDALFLDLINKYQPGASILGREWGLVGTEGGYVASGPDTLWYAAYPQGNSNDSANTYTAKQCDTSLSTSGWFWHGGAKPRFNASSGVDLYGYSCLGLGAGLILNLPPSTKGIIEPSFVEFAHGFKTEWSRRFGNPIATASGTAGTMGPGNTAVDMVWQHASTVDTIIVREDLRYGQRVAAWQLMALIGQPDGSKVWQPVGAGSTIGMLRIWSLTPPATAQGTTRFGNKAATNCFGVRFVALVTASADGLVHIAELSAHQTA